MNEGRNRRPSRWLSGELKTTDQNWFSIQTLLIVLVPSWRCDVRPGPEIADIQSRTF